MADGNDASSTAATVSVVPIPDVFGPRANVGTPVRLLHEAFEVGAALLDRARRELRGDPRPRAAIPSATANSGGSMT